MGIDERLAQEVVRRVLTAAKPDRIILFGSAAGGQMTPDSDIDLLIVERAPANLREESVKIRSALGDIGFPVDVIVISTERFEATKNIFGGIAYPAHKYGKVSMKPPESEPRALVAQIRPRDGEDLQAAGARAGRQGRAEGA